MEAVVLEKIIFEVVMKIFSEDLIRVNYFALDKKSCLLEMTEFLSEQGVIESQTTFLANILDRESLMSTGIGKRIAIPHARSNTALDFKIAVYLLDNELEFNSIDSLPVKIIFMIAVPEDMKDEYMKVLSVISNFFKVDENRQKILSCVTGEQLYNILKEIENEI